MRTQCWIQIFAHAVAVLEYWFRPQKCPSLVCRMINHEFCEAQHTIFMRRYSMMMYECDMTCMIGNDPKVMQNQRKIFMGVLEVKHLQTAANYFIILLPSYEWVKVLGFKLHNLGNSKSCQYRLSVHHLQLSIRINRCFTDNCNISVDV